MTAMLLALVFAAIPLQLAEAQTTSDDAAVYAAVLDSVFAGHSAERLIVTASTHAGPRIDVVMETQRDVIDSIPGIEASTRANFRHANGSPGAITEIAQTRIPVEIVPDSVIHALHDVVPPGPPPAGPPGLVNFWRAFRNRFPNSAGITRFSRISYSEDRVQAVVQIDHRCGSVCGEASLVLLARTAGAWQVASINSLWVY